MISRAMASVALEKGVPKAMQEQWRFVGHDIKRNWSVSSRIAGLVIMAFLRVLTLCLKGIDASPQFASSIFCFGG